MFMLVATIAATATFKWLTSENMSSSGRLQQNVARQAALAGIETARSWMTNNANETGAILKQYRATKTPVKIDNRLKSMNQIEQNFEVQVVGVEAVPSNSQYKVKLLSTGTSRNGTKYSEVAVLNIGGLYRVKLPVEKKESNYKYSYFGGSTIMGTNSTAESMIVNGNLTGSEISVNKDLIVTGNVFNNNTNFMRFGENTCIGGNLDVSNQGIEKVKNIYIHGNANNFSLSSNVPLKSITGNAYFNGDLRISSTGADVDIAGNMTLNKHLSLDPHHKFTVNGNLCLDKNADINFKYPTSQNEFNAKKDIWIPNATGIKYIAKDNYSYAILGESGANVYIANSAKCSKFYYKDDNKKLMQFGNFPYISWSSCNDGLAIQGEGTPVEQTYNLQFQQFTAYDISKHDTTNADNVPRSNFFKTHGTLYSTFSADNGPANYGITCADTIQKYCSQYLDPKSSDGCDGSKFKIKDILKTASTSFGKSKYQTKCVQDVLSKNFADLKDGNGVTLLNECWATVNKDSLYNGYLVIKSGSTKLNYIFTDTKQAFNGKFIIYLEDGNLTGKVAQTTENSIVFMYLPEGSKTLTQSGNPNGTNPLFNYFVFSKGNITGIFTESQRDWTGSFYMSAENCAKIEKVNDKQNLKYSQSIVDDLTTNGVICAIEATACGEEYAYETGETDPASTDHSGYDVDIIAVGNQLAIEAESQYKSMETYANGDTIVPSALVLPRVVYLNRDPKGKLKDYFKAVGLNGGSVTNNGLVSCPDVNAPPTSGKLYDGTNLLTEGIFICNYSENNLTSKFYVYVSGMAEDTPPVSFEKPQDVSLNGEIDHNVPISIQIGGSKSGGPFSVDIEVTNVPSGWNFIDNLSTNLIKRAGSNGRAVYTYTGNLSSIAQTIPLFEIKTSSTSNSGSMHFTLQTPENCIIGYPPSKFVYIQGQAEVVREDINSQAGRNYCDNHSSEPACQINFDERPICKIPNSKTWVYAKASTTFCNALLEPGDDLNKKWRCNTDPEIRLNSLPSAIPEYCEVFIPEEENFASIYEGNSGPYTLIGSILGKPYQLDVAVHGAQSSSTKVVVCRENTGGSVCTDVHDNAQMQIYGSERIVLYYEKGGEDIFNVWKCDGASCPSNIVTKDTLVLNVVGNANVIAKFNEIDTHCFYEDFKNGFHAFCTNGATNCIDKCTSSSGCGVKSTEAEWMMIYQNGQNKNDKNSVPPTINNDDGYIFLDNSKNSNSGSRKQAIVLKNTEAGYNGLMSVMFQTPTIDEESNGNNSLLNSGFIIRSTGDPAATFPNPTYEHIILLIYWEDNQNDLKARICRANDQGINNSNQGQCLPSVQFKDDGNNVQINPQSPDSPPIIKAKIHVVDDAISITATVDDHESYANIDMSESNVFKNTDNDKHNFIGMALSDNNFKVYDIGWASETYNESCFGMPSVSCIFKANYLGGLVPLNEDVMPWVGASSWYESNACTLEFYYNGCDNSNQSQPYYCQSTQSIGDPLSMGSYLGSSSNTNFAYNFSEQGIHGTAYHGANSAGFQWDAKVKVICPTNLHSSLANEIVSCGRFTVGTNTACKKNDVLLNETRTGGGSSIIEISFNETNLREANLAFNIVEDDDSKPIFVRLIDKNGIVSSDSYFSGTNTWLLSVNAVSNVDDFNPERIVGIQLSSDNLFSVLGIESSCPYTLSVSCQSANYTTHGMWELSAKINNASSCTAEPIQGNNSNALPLTLTDCQYGLFTLQETLSLTEDPTDFTFRIKAFGSDGTVDSCDITKTLTVNDLPSSSSEESNSSQYTPGEAPGHTTEASSSSIASSDNGPGVDPGPGPGPGPINPPIPPKSSSSAAVDPKSSSEKVDLECGIGIGDEIKREGFYGFDYNIIVKTNSGVHSNTMGYLKINNIGSNIGDEVGVYENGSSYTQSLSNFSTIVSENIGTISATLIYEDHSINCTPFVQKEAKPSCEISEPYPANNTKVTFTASVPAYNDCDCIFITNGESKNISTPTHTYKYTAKNKNNPRTFTVKCICNSSYETSCSVSASH